VAVACFLPGRAKDLPAPPRTVISEVAFHHKDPQYCLQSEGRNPARKKSQRISVQVALVSRPSCVRQQVGINKKL